ncbi:MAG: Ig-like domain-containing protein, partial [Edaphobacter sp.]
TMTASVASTTTGTPTGIVTFFDNGIRIGTGNLSNGVATFATAGLSVGNHVITTSYTGDTDFSPNTASGATGTTSILITPLDFTIQLTSQGTVEGTYGTTRQFTFHLTPIGATYPGTVQLVASPSGPILATYTFSPASIDKTAGPIDITLTVATRKLASSEAPKGWSSGISPIAFGLFLLPLFGLRYSRRSAGKLGRLVTYSALLLLSLGAIGSATGCGSGYFEHNYPITVTATSNGIQHAVNVDFHIDQAPQ